MVQVRQAANSACRGWLGRGGEALVPGTTEAIALELATA